MMLGTTNIKFRNDSYKFDYSARAVDLQVFYRYKSRGVFPRYTVRQVVGNRALIGTQYAHWKHLFKTNTISFDTLINILNLLCLLALIGQSFAAGLM